MSLEAIRFMFSVLLGLFTMPNRAIGTELVQQGWDDLLTGFPPYIDALATSFFFFFSVFPPYGGVRYSGVMTQKKTYPDPALDQDGHQLLSSLHM